MLFYPTLSCTAIPSSVPRAGLRMGKKKIWFSNSLLPHPALKPQDVEGKSVANFFMMQTAEEARAFVRYSSPMCLGAQGL